MRTTHTVRRHVQRSVMTAVVIAGLLTPLHAQPVVDLKRVIPNWPTIELYFTVTCRDLPVMFSDKSYFTVSENGKPQVFTLWCPDPAARCASSTVLLFDMSASMAGQGVSDAAAAGMNYLGLIDTLFEEVSVISFSQGVSVLQPMTTDLPALRNAMTGLAAATGTRHLWDATYEAVSQAMFGSHACRSVVVMTSGGDEGSASTMADVVALATRNRIRIHTIGYRAAGDTVSLADVAKQTGGQFNTAMNAADLGSILHALYMSNVMPFSNECYITYQAASPDGSRRTVELRVDSVCNGTATGTGIYHAPLLTSVDGMHPQAGTWCLEVFPDPMTSTATIALTGDSRECVHLMVMDAGGRLVLDLGERLNASNPVLTFSMAGRPAGVYAILGVTPTGTQIRQLIKL